MLGRPAAELPRGSVFKSTKNEKLHDRTKKVGEEKQRKAGLCGPQGIYKRWKREIKKHDLSTPGLRWHVHTTNQFQSKVQLLELRGAERSPKGLAGTIHDVADRHHPRCRT